MGRASSGTRLRPRALSSRCGSNCLQVHIMNGRMYEHSGPQVVLRAADRHGGAAVSTTVCMQPNWCTLTTMRLVAHAGCKGGVCAAACPAVHPLRAAAADGGRQGARLPKSRAVRGARHLLCVSVPGRFACGPVCSTADLCICPWLAGRVPTVGLGSAHLGAHEHLTVWLRSTA
jgi:hypothetical protein